MKHSDFDNLVGMIQDTTQVLQANTRAVINRSVTARAWLTGMYIVEYEQNGHDRAKYGEQLLKKLSERLVGSSFSESSLKKYRQFYISYPQLLEPIGHYLSSVFQGPISDKLLVSDNQISEIGQPLFIQSKNGQKSVVATNLPRLVGESSKLPQAVGVFPKVLAYVPWGHHREIVSTPRSCLARQNKDI